MTEQNLINDPAVSYWLKDQINKISERDLLDAISDAELLLSVLAGRYRAAFGVELYAGDVFGVLDIKCDSHKK